MIAKTLTLLFALAVSASAAAADSILPNSALTPGATFDVTVAQICARGYARSVRKVPRSARRAVFARYGLSYAPQRYELDHLVPLELGGSNAVENLWPEPYAIAKAGVEMGARVKDRLEDELHRRVCARSMSLRTAQAAIRGFWTNAYRATLGPL
jgi:hypothetical protein